MADAKRGKRGQAGRDGEDGERGPQGPIGPPGRSIKGERGERGEPGLSIKGDVGAQGPQGPMGPMPRHEWRTTIDGKVELRFQIAPSVWGEWSENLRGPRGLTGAGGGSTTVVNQGGTGTGGVGMAYPWFLS